ncbi:MAG: ASCH domain-containing protein [Bdellovibrionota bacterium]
MELDALIIKKEPLDKILAGLKTWELRGRRCKKRGLIALIESGSGTIVGTAELIECEGPLTHDRINENIKRLQVSRRLRPDEELPYETPYAWVLKNARRFKKPIPYNHKPGVVIWHPVEVPESKIPGVSRG